MGEGDDYPTGDDLILPIPQPAGLGFEAQLDSHWKQPGARRGGVNRNFACAHPTPLPLRVSRTAALTLRQPAAL